jgi:hypothetical protein
LKRAFFGILLVLALAPAFLAAWKLHYALNEQNHEVLKRLLALEEIKNEQSTVKLALAQTLESANAPNSRQKSILAALLLNAWSDAVTRWLEQRGMKTATWCGIASQEDLHDALQRSFDSRAPVVCNNCWKVGEMTLDEKRVPIPRCAAVLSDCGGRVCVSRAGLSNVHDPQIVLAALSGGRAVIGVSVFDERNDRAFFIIAREGLNGSVFD